MNWIDCLILYNKTGDPGRCPYCGEELKAELLSFGSGLQPSLFLTCKACGRSAHFDRIREKARESADTGAKEEQMKRHPEFSYQAGKREEKSQQFFIRITDPEQSGWHTALFDPWSEDNDSGPVELLLRIRDRLGWTLKKVGWGQCAFEEDPLQIIFQWDDLFGFFFIVDSKEKVDGSIRFLRDFMKKGKA